jgi:hypothetical protein
MALDPFGARKRRSAGSVAPASTPSRGIERVLVRAAVDRRFRARLSQDRGRALDASGVPLSAGERSALLAVPDAQLEAMVDGLATRVVDRRGWFARVAGVLGVFLGGASLSTTATSCSPFPACTGSRPESEPPIGTGSRPDDPSAGGPQPSPK